MSRRVVAWLPAASASLAEGSWIGVLAALAVALGSPLEGLTNGGLGPWVLAVVAALGLAVTRRVPPQSSRWVAPAVVASSALAAGLAGLVVDAPASGAFLAGLAGLAAWRGTRHGDPSMDDAVASDVLRLGVPALAIPWIFGAAVPGSTREAFVAAALPATLLFVGASLAAVGLTRLDALGRESGLDWTTNRAWLVLLAGILAALAVLAVPAAWLLGVPVSQALRGLLAPAATAADAGRGLVDAIAPAPAPATSQGPTPTANPGALLPDGLPAWAILAASVVALLLLAGLAAWVWRKVRGTPRDAAAAVAAPRIEHRIELPTPHLRLPAAPRLHLRRRRRRPRTASEAYLATLEHLARDAPTTRQPAESARAHARRLAAALGPRLGLLAADFELERYAGRRVTVTETRRALGRAAWVRRR